MRLLKFMGKVLTFDENEVSTEEFAKVNQNIFTALPHNARQIQLENVPNPYLPAMLRFAESILAGTSPIADGYDGLREVQLANAVYVSGWEEKRVALPVAEERYLNGLRARQKAELDEI